MVFLDTNVLVYAAVPASPDHRRSLAALAGKPATEGAAVSRQVLREFVAVVSRTQLHGAPQPPAAIAAVVRSFEEQFTVLEDGPAVTAKLLELLTTIPIGGKQVHDANLVATMLVHGVTELITANEADFRRYAGLITLVPWPGQT